MVVEEGGFVESQYLWTEPDSNVLQEPACTFQVKFGIRFTGFLVSESRAFAAPEHGP
jgi:hypothetical protein